MHTGIVAVATIAGESGFHMIAAIAEIELKPI